MAKAKPKLDWLATGQERYNSESSFRRLGSTDVTLALAIGEEFRKVTFEAFEISQISEIQQEDTRDVELVLTMTAKDWNAYLRRRAGGKGETLLSLDLEERVFSASDPFARLKLERFNRSLQAFVDVGAELSA